MNGAWQRVETMLGEAVAAGVSPSAALAVGRGKTLLTELYVGRSGAEPVGTGTTYDLSSLTKPLATTALLMQACAGGRLGIEAKVTSILPEFQSSDPRRAHIGVGDLLGHASGLPAHREFFVALEEEERRSGRALVGKPAGAARIAAYAAHEPLEYEPRSRAVYSDVGFILLGRIVEIVAGAPLNELFHARVAEPLALDAIGFIASDAPHSALSRAAAPCGRCDWRGRRICGEVQDQNASAMGGVAGHAGLFGNLRSVHAVVAEHVSAWNGTSKLLPADVVRAFWKKDEGVSGSTWALGWDTPSESQSSAGRRIGRPAVGHLGFTGTSIWVDLARGVHVILLTNRIEAGGDNSAIRALRPLLHDAVFEAVDRIR